MLNQDIGGAFSVIAIILAAGKGTRLKNFTRDNTKCMIEVNGEKLIDRTLKGLLKNNISEIIIVVGYKGVELQNYIERRYFGEKIKFLNNKEYETTNNIYSLWIAKEYLLNNDVILLESDVIFESEVINQLILNPNPNLAVVSKYERWMNGTMVKIDDNNNIVKLTNTVDSNIELNYKTVNIYKFSAIFLKSIFIPFLDIYIEINGKNCYYEQVLNILELFTRINLKTLLIPSNTWYEIDDPLDLYIANIIFGKDKLTNIQRLYGGYWKIPGIIDFCYLSNTYFPTQEMYGEFKKVIPTLINSYPSGSDYNNFLASNILNIDSKYICVSNGASELINYLPKVKKYKKIGLIVPTFEEYLKAFDQCEIVKLETSSNNFALNSEELIRYFAGKKVEALLLINPNIPNGSLLNRESILTILQWAKQNIIDVIIDESFMDFSNNGLYDTVLDNQIFKVFTNLIFIKSISKSYGVPGVRLGILATSNLDIIDKLKIELPIWNINSFAEYFMEILIKNEVEYTNSLKKVIVERERLRSELTQLQFLKIFPSQANFLLCKVLLDVSSTDLVNFLLKNYGILIKDCKGKIGMGNGEYVRIAIRSYDENNFLVSSLRNFYIHFRENAETFSPL